MARFNQRLLAHLREQFAPQMARADALQCAQLMEHLIERARHWGLVSEAHVVGFAEVAMRLHPRFDELPEFAWAQQILADEFIVAPELRLQTLSAATERALAELAVAEPAP